jgi:uncharacterized protein
MPYVVSIGTYLPCWGTSQRRVAGDVTQVDGFFTGVDRIGYEGQGSAAGFRVTTLEGPVAHGR